MGNSHNLKILKLHHNSIAEFFPVSNLILGFVSYIKYFCSETLLLSKEVTSFEVLSCSITGKWKKSSVKSNLPLFTYITALFIRTLQWATDLPSNIQVCIKVLLLISYALQNIWAFEGVCHLVELKVKYYWCNFWKKNCSKINYYSTMYYLLIIMYLSLPSLVSLLLYMSRFALVSICKEL